MMGFATLHIETAGLGFVEGETPRAEGLIPMVEQAEIVDLVEKAIPQNRIDPWTSTLHPAHFRALIRALGLRFFRTCLLVSLVAIFAGPWALSLFGLLILAIPATWLDWRKQGWAVDQHSVVSRRGFFTRRTWMIPRDKLQSVAVDQTLGCGFMDWGESLFVLPAPKSPYLKWPSNKPTRSSLSFSDVLLLHNKLSVHRPHPIGHLGNIKPDVVGACLLWLVFQ